MVALNAGGTRAVKYGVIRNYVKGLEVVLPTGEIMNFGGKLLKKQPGFRPPAVNGQQFGPVGCDNKVTFRLYPRPGAMFTLVVSYDKFSDAIDTVPKILRSGVIPLALEYFMRDVIEEASRRVRHQLARI